MKITIFLMFFTSNAFAINLKIGDILLQPLDCWVCKLIEKEEGSKYSHMSVVIQTSPEILVAHAWENVKVQTLKEFNTLTKKGAKLMVRRHISEADLNILKDLYYKHFDGVPYDKAYRWDNDSLYCSEFVYKLYKHVTDKLTPPKKMHYNFARDYWNRYFNGNIPDGLPGNSPADFEKSKFFKTIGFI